MHFVRISFALAIAGGAIIAQSRPASAPATRAESVEVLIAKLSDGAASRPSVLLALGQRVEDAKEEIGAPESSPATESRAARRAGSKRLLDVVATAIPAIVPSLRSPDWRERDFSAWILGNLGPAAASTIPALMALCADPDPRVRDSASRSVAFIVPPSGDVVPSLITALESPDANVRQNIAWAVSQMGDKAGEAMPTVMKLLSDQRGMTRANAADALGAARWQPAVPSLLPLLTDPHERVRDRASRALSEIVPQSADVVPDLIAALDSPDANVRQNVSWTLYRMGTVIEAIPALAERLADEREITRINAAQALGSLAENAKRAEAALIAALESASPKTRPMITWALAKIGPQLPGSAAPLIAVLRDPDPGVRQDAAWALYCLGPAARDAVPELITLLSDERSSTRGNAAAALGAIGPAARSRAPALLAMLDHSGAEGIAAAADALQLLEMASDQAVGKLVARILEGDRAVREAAADAIANLGAAAATARPTLLVMLLHDQSLVALQAAASIGVDFGVINRNASASQELEILSNSEHVITGIKSSDENIRVSYELDPDKQCFRITVRPDSKIRVGPIHATLTIATTDPKKQSIEIPVSGRVEDQVVVKPRVLRFGTSSLGSAMMKTIQVVTESGGDLVIESLEVEPPGLFTATVEKTTPQASSIGVSIDPQAPEGPLSAVLRIKTNRPGETDLRARLLAVTKK